jgi:SagB-type dehydrogenase family enzyme
MTLEPEYWQLLGAPRLDALSELLHENTKVSPTSRGFVISAELRKVMAAGYKTYESADRIALAPPSHGLSMPIGEAMRRRKSVRTYTGYPLSAHHISDLVFHGCGLVQQDAVRRIAPSAGGLFPLEIYPVVLNVDGIPRGVYHYDVLHHELERLPHSADLQILPRSVFVDGMMEGAGAVIVISAVFGRSKIKYGERGYRFVLLEAGHVAQNLVLAATGLSLGSCPIGGFVDDYINELIDVDGLDEAALYMVVVGSVAAEPGRQGADREDNHGRPAPR